MNRYKPVGWRGNSHGHSLAAKGIRKYSATKLVDPVFLAAKREQDISSTHIREMVLDDATFEDAVKMHPDVDKEDLRTRMIKAVDMKNGNVTLSLIDRNGVDLSVSMAKASPMLKENMLSAIKNNQSKSLIPTIKIESLSRGLSEL